MKVSRLPATTGRFVLLAVALAGVMLVSPLDAWTTFWVVNAVLGALFVLDLWLAVSPASLELYRASPEVVPLNVEAQIEWRVVNRSKRATSVALVDQLPPSFGYEDRRSFLWTPGSGESTSRCSIRPRRRGRFVLSQIAVRTTGPLGLAARHGVHGVFDVMRVYPSFKSKREAELRIERARVAEVGMRSVRAHGGGTEFEQLRDYSVDDDYRHIDWAATARSARPIVRSFRAERNQNVFCVLDCGRVMAGRVDGVPRLEHAMDGLMALGTVATRLGDRVGMLAFDRVIRSDVGLGHGNAQVARIVDAIYQLEPELYESDYRAAFVRLLSRFRRRGLVVVFTELSEHSVNESLIPAIGLIAKRNVVMIASVADPDVSMWARAVPSESNKAFRKAAATKALADRGATRAKLQAAGATVVDATPGKLAAQLTDAYLRVKATGRL